MKKLLIVGCCVLFAGCVSSGKFKKLENEHQASVQQLNKMQLDIDTKESKIQELETLISQLERRLGRASDDKESLRASVVQMKQALQEMSKRKKETERRMLEFRNLVSKLKSFTQSGQLSIKIVDGRMVVALPGDVLFSSGSAKLSDEGKKTVGQVSAVLKDIDQRSFQVEGHTDNIPIKTSQFPSNWELASLRASNVVREMLDAGMPKERISVASFADARPVASNDAPQGRQLNRRIEIVIVPDMSALPGYDELNQLADDAANPKVEE